MKTHLSPAGHEVIVDTGLSQVIRHPQYGVALLGPFIGVVTEDGAAIVPKGWERLEDEETHYVSTEV